MTKTLFEQVVDYKNLQRSYKQTQKGIRKFRKDAILYDMCRERNLVQLWNELRKGQYKIGEYIRFNVFEPKERTISAPRIRDKIVQFAVHTVLQEVYRPVFITTTYACLEGRGTHRAVRNVQHDMRLCKWQHGEGWVVKIDIKKFFYSINRDILKKVLRKKVKDEKMLAILDQIIDSSPEGEKGIPLGNVTSQDFANIYMNELDQFVKRFWASNGIPGIWMMSLSLYRPRKRPERYLRR